MWLITTVTFDLSDIVNELRFEEGQEAVATVKYQSKSSEDGARSVTFSSSALIES